MIACVMLGAEAEDAKEGTEGSGGEKARFEIAMTECQIRTNRGLVYEVLRS